MKIVDGLDLANQQLHNLADGSSATDAVTLQQMQAFVRGLDWKPSVRAASTSNVTIATPGGSLDGVTGAAGDRWLLKNQTTASENGLYTWTASSSALTRTLDASSQDGTQTLSAGLAVLVTEGTVNKDTAWVLTTDDPIVVGTTALSLVQFGGSGAPYTAGNGIAISTNVVSVQAVSGGGISVVAGGVQIDYTKVATKFSTNVGDGSTTAITVTHGLGTTDVIAILKEVSSKNIVGMTINVVDSNNVLMTFPSAPTSGQYRLTVIA